jgi:hypothetical protein
LSTFASRVPEPGLGLLPLPRRGCPTVSSLFAMLVSPLVTPPPNQSGRYIRGSLVVGGRRGLVGLRGDAASRAAPQWRA